VKDLKPTMTREELLKMFDSSDVVKKIRQSYVAPQDGAISAWKLVTDFTPEEENLIYRLEASLKERYGFSEIRVWGLLKAKDIK